MAEQVETGKAEMLRTLRGELDLLRELSNLVERARWHMEDTVQLVEAVPEAAWAITGIHATRHMTDHIRNVTRSPHGAHTVAGLADRASDTKGWVAGRLTVLCGAITATGGDASAIQATLDSCSGAGRPDDEV